MANNPQASIPQRFSDWADTLGCYRFFNNQRVDPQAVQQAAVAQTRADCLGRAVVLCLHDLSPLKPVQPMSPTTLQQHTVLAVDGQDDRQVIGLLRQHWFDDPKAQPGETRGQRRTRWTRSKAWPEAVEALGTLDSATRWVHVADREGDDFQLFTACNQAGHGFVIRSQHDRCLAKGGRLRAAMDAQPVQGGLCVSVARRSAVGPAMPPDSQRRRQAARLARLEVRFATLTFSPPQNDARFTQNLTLNVVSVRERQTPADAQAIDWLLLTSEPVTQFSDALQVVQWYQQRWLIEEFHKAQKTGCRLEAAQLHRPEAICVLAAIAGVVAVRLLQLRQAAADAQTASVPASQVYDRLWVTLVAHLARHDPATLTVRQFYHAIARYGGWLARKHDGPPGWQTLWRGWRRIADHVAGIQLFQAASSQSEQGCV